MTAHPKTPRTPGTRRATRPRRAVLAVVAGVAVTLAACGGGDDGPDATTTVPPTTTTVPPTTTTVPPTTTTVVTSYVIQPGDTLNRIAYRFGITPSALAEANGITDPDRIEAGDELVIPAPTASTTAPATPASTATATTVPAQEAGQTTTTGT